MTPHTMLDQTIDCCPTQIFAMFIIKVHIILQAGMLHCDIISEDQGVGIIKG